MFLFDSDLWPAASSCSLQIWARLTGFLPCWRWAAGIPVSDRARSGTVRCRRLYNSIHSQDRPRLSAKLRPATSLCFLWDHCTMICRFQAKISQNPKVAGHNAATPQASTSFRFWGFGQLAVAKALQIRRKQCVFGTWCSSLAHDFRRFQVLPRFCGDSPVYQCQGRQQAWLEGGAPGPMVTYPSYTRLSRLFATG